ncbi:UNVERIFIED_ORG: hypothetical protein B2H93_14015 [Clostridium botulinum]
MNQLGEKIKELRTQKGWSLDELATRSGVPKTTIWGIEKGSQPSYDKINRLAAAFDIPTNELIIPGMADVSNILNNTVKEQITVHKIKNMMEGEYGVDGVALFFLFHDIVKNRFNCDFEKFSISEQNEILSNMYLAIELKLNEILKRHKTSNKKEGE